MASVPTYSNKLSTGAVFPFPKSTRLNRTVTKEIAIQKMCRSFSSISGNKRRPVLYHANTKYPFQTINKVYVVTAISGEENRETSKSSGTARQARTLDSYFDKSKTGEQQNSSMSLRDSETAPDFDKSKMKPSSQLPSKTGAMVERRNDQLTAKKELGFLEEYMEKLNTEFNSKKNFSSFDNETTEATSIRTPISVARDYEKSEEKDKYNYGQLGIKDEDPDRGNYQSQWPHDEASDLYLVCMLASINIAVFLFEIATPVRNSSVELFTLPSLYGAKINQLILDGEWWRLVTPMFLHSGIIHVALGCWVLLTLGPQVSKGYGSCTFFLIYLLGGISGNLTSFLHTPETTVGGTDPIFALIGAWLIYQVQNKEVISKEITESMFSKAVIATVISSVLSNFGPIDDWAHLGAACAGIAYGFLTCPILQLDNASSKNGGEDGIALVKRYADPRKSTITFALFIIILSFMYFFLEPQVNPL